MKKTILIVLTVLMPTYLLSGQNYTERQTNEKERILNSNSDTLSVAYTYWWTDSGPFIGLCGDKYSLVFLGVVAEINTPAADTSSLYVPQTGIIEITEILKKVNLEKEKYVGQKYFSSDCFDNTKLKKGDPVIVFCYQYEGYYSIPSQNSIVKIKGKNDPAILSIKQYIKAGQNPIEIKDDMALWKEKGFGNELKQIIKCKETFDNKK